MPQFYWKLLSVAGTFDVDELSLDLRHAEYKLKEAAKYT